VPRTAHQLKITLLGVTPAVWRRLLVPSGITLDRLHLAIQEAFGWAGAHLHEYEIGGARYGPEDQESDEAADEPVVDERSAVLHLLAVKGAIFTYEYDFGDAWEHRVVVEDVLAADPKASYPQCTGGRRACPPEDVGGAWGYARFLEAIADPEHPEHDELLAWVGGTFDPERVDLLEINTALTPCA
jgi:hypothetical protein